MHTEEELTQIMQDARADIRINRYKLDEECERQSTLFLFYSNLLADAKIAEDAAEDHLDEILSKTELRIRNDPPNGKMTESSVKALVASDESVLKAKEQLRKEKAERYKFDGIVSSFGHKKSELDNLTIQWSKGYYMSDAGIPKTGNDLASDDLRHHLKSEKEKN